MGLLLCVYDFHPAQIWDIIEKYDTGCTPGGGRDAMSVFYDAGLLFESNRGSGTPYRQGETSSLKLSFLSFFLLVWFKTSIKLSS